MHTHMHTYMLTHTYSEGVDKPRINIVVTINLFLLLKLVTAIPP